MSPGERCHDGDGNASHHGQRGDARPRGHGFQEFACQEGADRVGVNLHTWRHPFVGQRERRIKRSCMSVIGLVIGPEQHHFSFDPPFELRLVPGSHGLNKIDQGDARESICRSGVVDGEIALVPGRNLPAAQIEMSVAELRGVISAQEFFRSQQGHTARCRLAFFRRFEEFLPAYKVVRIVGKVGIGRHARERTTAC